MERILINFVSFMNGNKLMLNIFKNFPKKQSNIEIYQFLLKTQVLIKKKCNCLW